MKTGTTSLQNYCHKNRDYLLRQGLLYPLTGLTLRSDSDPKHQILISHLVSQNLEGLDSWILGLLEEKRSHIDIDHLLISSEGFYNHFYDFGDSIDYFVAALREYFNVKIIFFYRDLTDYFKSYYKQILCNPPINDDLGYGLDLSPAEFLNLPRIQENLNFAQILEDYKKLVGQENMLIFDYKMNSTVDNLMKYFNIPVLPYQFLNSSVPDTSVDSLIEYNRIDNNLFNRNEFIRELRELNDGECEQFQLVSDSINQELRKKQAFWMPSVKRQYSWI